MIEIIICLIAGIGAGLGTGFAGMSAAAIISPMLITFLKMNPYEAIGIALASDVLASAISAFTYGRNKDIDIKKSLTLFVSVLSFTLIGAYISHLVPSTAMGNISVYMTLLLGITFLIKSFKEEKVKQPREFSPKLKIVLPIICGALIGFICGFVGAGGGMMMLLLLTGVLGYELKKAIGTSVFIMTFTALFGATSHFTLSNSFPDIKILCLCVLFTFIFARIGSKYATQANPRHLKRAIGIILTLSGIFMLFF